MSKRGIKLLDCSIHWTDQRCELVQWLDGHAPSFTEGYVAAVQLLHTPSFPARVHLICHIVRDFYRYLPAALGMESESRPGEIFPSMVKNLTQQWGKTPPPATMLSEEIDSNVLVNTQVLRCVEEIVEKSKELTEQPRVGEQLAIALYRTLDRREEEFIPPWVLDAFHKEYKFFVTRAHLAIKFDKVPSDDGLVDHFQAFERAFHSSVGQYFTGKQELDEILQDTNREAN